MSRDFSERNRPKVYSRHNDMDLFPELEPLPPVSLGTHLAIWGFIDDTPDDILFFDNAIQDSVEHALSHVSSRLPRPLPPCVWQLLQDAYNIVVILRLGFTAKFDASLNDPFSLSSRIVQWLEEQDITDTLMDLEDDVFTDFEIKVLKILDQVPVGDIQFTNFRPFGNEN